MQSHRIQDFSCVSLFSGCGGLDYGLQRAGFSIVAATDIDQNCQKSHAINFPEAKFIKAGARELTDDVLREMTRGYKTIDLVAGGPPCPPFSKSRFYRKEKPRALDDPNGRETFDAYLRTLRVIQPRAFILENVKGLSYKVHADALTEFSEEAANLGFVVNMAVLNAADFGVPQNRERCFVVGLRGAQFEFPVPTHSRDGVSGTTLWQTAGDAIGDLDTPDTWGDDGHRAGGRHHDLLKLVPPGQNYLYFTEKRGHPEPIFKWRSRYWSFLLKLSPDLPSWTIQARRSNNMGPFHWRNRILRVPEIKRLQTFPDHFALEGRVEEQWRQIGNAVPPVLAEAVGWSVAKQLGVPLGDVA